MMGVLSYLDWLKNCFPVHSNFFFKKQQASLKIEIKIFYVVSSVHIMQMAFA